MTFLDKINDFLVNSCPPLKEKRKADEDWERTWGHKIGKPWEKVETYGEQYIREMREQSARRKAQVDSANCARRQKLRRLFEEAGRKQNFAEDGEVDTLLSLTEKKIIQQCRRKHCRGCKLGYVCPKYYPEG